MHCHPFWWSGKWISDPSIRIFASSPPYPSLPHCAAMWPCRCMAFPFYVTNISLKIHHKTEWKKYFLPVSDGHGPLRCIKVAENFLDLLSCLVCHCIGFAWRSHGRIYFHYISYTNCPYFRIFFNNFITKFWYNVTYFLKAAHFKNKIKARKHGLQYLIF